jgi:hypothetical protein
VVALTAQPDESPVVIRYAETDEDVIAMHQFLLVVAQPAMRAPVDVQASLMELIRVTKEEVAIMAIKDGRLIGTMGLIRPSWWYAPDHSFLCDRWHFILPEHQHGVANKLLIEEARKIAAMAGLEFIHQGKIRVKSGASLMMPTSYPPESDNLEAVGA